MYLIIYTYKGQREEIDSADTLKEANYLLREYQLAYGPGSILEIVKA